MATNPKYMQWYKCYNCGYMWANNQGNATCLMCKGIGRKVTWRQEAMKHNFEKGYGVAKVRMFNHYCKCMHLWASEFQEDTCPLCGEKDRVVGPGVLPQFTHICTQCNNVFIGTMEDTTCPNCKSKAEHTVQHLDDVDIKIVPVAPCVLEKTPEAPLYNHWCSGCEHTWIDDNPLAKHCPKCTLIGKTALEKQEGGSHYKDMKIQPVEFIHANNIPFFEANVIKYVCRWRNKNGVEDLKKAIHYLQLLIELEANNESK